MSNQPSNTESANEFTRLWLASALAVRLRHYVEELQEISDIQDLKQRARAGWGKLVEEDVPNLRRMCKNLEPYIDTLELRNAATSITNTDISVSRGAEGEVWVPRIKSGGALPKETKARALYEQVESSAFLHVTDTTSQAEAALIRMLQALTHAVKELNDPKNKVELDKVILRDITLKFDTLEGGIYRILFARKRMAEVATGQANSSLNTFMDEKILPEALQRQMTGCGTVEQEEEPDDDGPPILSFAAAQAARKPPKRGK